MNSLIILTVSQEMLDINFNEVEQTRLRISNQVGEKAEVIVVPNGMEVALESKYEMYSGSKIVDKMSKTGTFRTNEELLNWLDIKK